ncbi:MAG: PAS domain-containing protein [Alphaproteobacteria bacterium]|nr:PAS domain-containing protein [Alphaproteobacteria bacterium]
MGRRLRFGNVSPALHVHAAGPARRIQRAIVYLGFAAGAAGAGAITPVFAQSPGVTLARLEESSGVVGLSVFAALIIFVASTALLHMTGRRRWLQREAQLDGDLLSARAALDRANVFLSTESQIIIAWASAASEPEIEGDMSLIMDAPAPRRVLGFGSWLPPESAQNAERCVERLRSRGEAFRISLVSNSGRHLELDGRAVGGRAVMRIRDISGDRLELTQLRERHARTIVELESLRALLDSGADPAWTRDGEGRLLWVNAAYVRAVEASDAREAVLKGADLLDRQSREAAAALRAKGETWRARAPVVVAGERRVMQIAELPAPCGSAGIAVDMSELEAVRRDLGRQNEAHVRTLDQLKTAVAIFDRSKRLVFHNTEYRQLWALDAAFLEQLPLDAEILDRLRAERKLPEQADFRAWRNGLMASYQSNEMLEQIWHLPDGRTLRAVINPNPQGGITYLFDDVTERYQIESQYNVLTRVQGETLDTLKEGVAVFGSDGRLKLSNPAFAQLWKLTDNDLTGQPHIDAVAQRCAPLDPGSRSWDELRSIVAGLHDARTSYQMRIYCANGMIVDASSAPLSDGATLLTFVDVTAAVMHNQAIEEANRIRNDFVHHVSYELRSPLTNIIGYAELLGDPSVGSLNAKQQEYAGHVRNSSSALLAIIDDILDLATVDNGDIELDIDDVDVHRTIAAAVEGVQDRLAETGIRLNVVASDNIGTFPADGNRLRQILFNLLSNAIGFSSPGQTVTIAATRREGEMVFKVSDNGRGIPASVIDRVFDRFHTDTSGARHRGAGLGLSIVRAFVERHDGRVTIDSAPGEGTVVTCIFPLRPSAMETPAQPGANTLKADSGA